MRTFLKKLIARLKYTIAGFLFLFSINSSIASEETHKEKFNAGEMIMHHISDSHEIHFFGEVSIYLPVIIKGNNGIEIFSSSNFYHNPTPFEVLKNGITKEEHGYSHNRYILFHETIYNADSVGGLFFNAKGEPTNEKPLDLSITKSVFGLLFTILLMVIIFSAVAKGYKTRVGKAPRGIQNLFEPFILFIRNEVAVPSIGEKKADYFMPFLLTMFFFIWIANMIGLIPFIGGFNITGTLSVTIVLAALVFIITTIKGGGTYWSHIFWPSGVPTPIKFILVPIEIAGIFIKPVVLMVRLTANITAGHIIMMSFVSLIFIFAQNMGAGAGYGVGIGATIFMVFMNFIELLVAFLQAYVFTLLAAIYFGDAVQEAHH
jgi:F-type H+-transporting ATPase subunit a